MSLEDKSHVFILTAEVPRDLVRYHREVMEWEKYSLENQEDILIDGSGRRTTI